VKGRFLLFHEAPEIGEEGGAQGLPVRARTQLPPKLKKEKRGGGEEESVSSELRTNRIKGSRDPERQGENNSREQSELDGKTWGEGK